MTIASVLEIAVFEAKGVLDAELVDVILKSAAEVMRREAAGEIEPTWHDIDLEKGARRFTEEVERLGARKQSSSSARRAAEFR